MMSRLFLARHGETVWNQEHRLQGHSDIGLSPAGRGHARRLVQFFRNRRVDVVYSSTLRRAVKTAMPLAEELRLPVIRREELREIGFGILEGKAPDDPDSQIREMLKKRQRDKSGFVPPGGESYRQVEERVVPFLAELHARHPQKSVLIVGHRGVNRVILGTVLGLSPEEYVQFDQCHDTVYEIRFETHPQMITHRLAKDKV